MNASSKIVFTIVYMVIFFAGASDPPMRVLVVVVSLFPLLRKTHRSRENIYITRKSIDAVFFGSAEIKHARSA